MVLLRPPIRSVRSPGQRIRGSGASNVLGDDSEARCPGQAVVGCEQSGFMTARSSTETTSGVDQSGCCESGVLDSVGYRQSQGCAQQVFNRG